MRVTVAPFMFCPFVTKLPGEDGKCYSHANNGSYSVRFRCKYDDNVTGRSCGGRHRTACGLQRKIYAIRVASPRAR